MTTVEAQFSVGIQGELQTTRQELCRNMLV